MSNFAYIMLSMSQQKPSDHLFNLKAEIDAVTALRTLIFELKQDARSSNTFNQGVVACQTLCDIAQAPNHYLGLQLIRLLNDPHGVSSLDIASMVNSFMFNITAQIDFYRLNFTQSNQA